LTYERKLLCTTKKATYPDIVLLRRGQLMQKVLNRGEERVIEPKFKGR